MTKKLYLLSSGLFLLLFLVSIILNIVDFETSVKETVRLGFPYWLPYPQTLAKFLGLLAIYASKSKTLKDFAFAGFLFNLFCALGGHIAQKDSEVFLPIIGIFVWMFAFIMDRKLHIPKKSRR